MSDLEQTPLQNELIRLRNQRSKALNANYGPCVWTYHEPEIVGGAVKVRCLKCKTLLTATNPTASMNSHFGGKNCNDDGRTAKVSNICDNGGFKIQILMFNFLLVVITLRHH